MISVPEGLKRKMRELLRITEMEIERITQDEDNWINPNRKAVGLENYGIYFFALKGNLGQLVAKLEQYRQTLYDMIRDIDDNSTREYYPCDGDYEESQIEDLCRLARDLNLKDYDSLELCLSIYNGRIRVLSSNDVGDDWVGDDYFDVPPNWEKQDVEELLSGCGIYLDRGNDE